MAWGKTGTTGKLVQWREDSSNTNILLPEGQTPNKNLRSTVLTNPNARTRKFTKSGSKVGGRAAYVKKLLTTTKSASTAKKTTGRRILRPKVKSKKTGVAVPTTRAKYGTHFKAGASPRSGLSTVDYRKLVRRGLSQSAIKSLPITKLKYLANL